MTDTTNQQQAKAAGALRARRYRQRRKDGERCIRFRVTQKALDQFVRLGLLEKDARHDPGGIERVFYELANVSLATWDVLTQLGALPRDRPTNSDRIKDALYSGRLYWRG